MSTGLNPTTPSLLRNLSQVRETEVVRAEGCMSLLSSESPLNEHDFDDYKRSCKRGGSVRLQENKDLLF